MKSFYTLGVNFLIAVDPSKPATLTKAAEWMEKMSKGEIAVPTDGLEVLTEITKAPAILNKKEKAAAAPTTTNQVQAAAGTGNKHK